MTIDVHDVQKLVLSGWKRMTHVAYLAVRLLKQATEQKSKAA